jgi:hypothetical protein
MRDALDVLRNHPFADVWQSMLRQAVLPGADLVLGAEQPEVLRLLRDEELCAATLRSSPPREH